MGRSFNDLMAAFCCDSGGRKFLVYALCRGDAQRLLAQCAGVGEHEIFVRRLPEADAWGREDDLESRARAAGFVLGCPRTDQGLPRSDRVDDELQLQREALEHWPGVEVMAVRQLEGVVQVHLLFDGGDGERHAFWLPDAGEVLVAPVDRPAWLAFCEAQKSQEG